MMQNNDKTNKKETKEIPLVGGLAHVELWAYPPAWGQKVLVPPPPPQQLNWPTTYGPNYRAQIDGALLTPATVLTPRGSQPVAGVKIRIRPSGIESEVQVGIIPFKDSR